MEFMGKTDSQFLWRAAKCACLHDDLFISGEYFCDYIQGYWTRMTDSQLHHDNVFISRK